MSKGEGTIFPLDLGKFWRKFGQIQRKFGLIKKRKDPSENIKIRVHTMLHTHGYIHTLSITQKYANIVVSANIEKIIDIFGAKKDTTILR